MLILCHVEFIWPSGLVLIIDHAGTSTVILSQFKWQYKLVALGRALSRRYDQTIIGIDKDDVAVLKLLYSPVVPFPAEYLPFSFVRTRKIKHLRIKGCLQNIRVLQCIDLPLACIYRSCLELARQNSVESIAFCCISTGVFHFPNQRAAEIAVETVGQFKAETGSEMKVIFNVFKDLDLEIYRRLLTEN